MNWFMERCKCSRRLNLIFSGGKHGVSTYILGHRAVTLPVDLSGVSLAYGLTSVHIFDNCI